MGQPIMRRVYVVKLKVPAWEQPAALETALNTVVGPLERIISVLPGPKMTAFVVVTEQ